MNSCCVWFSVETGAKIIGYIGALSNSINIIVAIIMIVALAVGPTPTPNPNSTTTTEWPSTSLPGLYDDSNVNPVNLADDINVNRILPDYDLHNVMYTIILLVFAMLIDMFSLCSNIVMLMGLYKRIASYVKFGLTVGIITTIVTFVITVGAVVAAPSVVAFASLMYFAIPVYLLLVIRSAYYDMLEVDLIQPIYTFDQSFGKGPYHEF